MNESNETKIKSNKIKWKEQNRLILKLKLKSNKWTEINLNDENDENEVNDENEKVNDENEKVNDENKQVNDESETK